MDWGRAKSVLIVSFLLLNLLLGYQLWYDQVSPAGANPDAQEFAQEIAQMMALKNIKMNAEVPKDTPKLRKIEVRITPPLGNPPTVFLSSPFPVSDLEDKSSLKNTLSKQIPDGENYKLDSFDTKEKTYVFYQMHGLYPMFDVRLELHADEESVTTFSQNHAEVLSGAVEKEQKVLSGMKAVEILVGNYLQSGSTIIDVQLGYHGQAFNSETRILAPYWRFVTDRGDRFFVHAITGAVDGVTIDTGDSTT